MARYTLDRHDNDDAPKEFNDKAEFENIKRMLDEAEIEYTAEVPESELPAETDGGEMVAKEPEPASKIDNAEEFVTEIAGVPKAFVMSMGKGGNSKPYVTKEGLTYIASKMGLQIRAEPIRPGWEGHDTIVWKGIVEGPAGETWEDYGTVHPEAETLGEENHDELCSSRATNRALRLATGCGMCTVEELVEGAENAVDEQGTPEEAEMIEAEVVN